MRPVKILIPIILVTSALIALHSYLHSGSSDATPLQSASGSQKEYCLTCHSGMSGFAPAHNPQKIGCVSCHAGNGTAPEKKAAHRGFVRVPGNLATAMLTCGQTGCHPAISANIQTSLMATGRGIVSVDRFVFGEAPSPDGEGHLSALGNSPADRHLRNLCASCHLNLPKTEPKPIGELSRGGGCTACHLNYSRAAQKQLKTFQKSGKLPAVHPALTLTITNDHCFGCHSRSGRISTNYEGWHETLLRPEQAHPDSLYRHLEDGRILSRQTPDVHHEKGMACIDCHNYRETMGVGRNYRHEEEAVEISCGDCHFSGKPETVGWKKLNAVERKILRLRSQESKSRRYLAMRRNGRAILNAYLDANGRPVLEGKLSGKTYKLKPPDALCTREISGHRRLSCQGCHTAWAPQCVSCHTEFDAKKTGWDHLKRQKIKGRWVEYRADFLPEPPVLGVRKAGREIVDVFVPGMILTIDKRKSGNAPPGVHYQIFQRLYAPVAPHTIAKKGRDCRSCHNNPLAIGFGRGTLGYVKLQNGKGRWNFEPAYQNHPADGLPYDAWTEFLRERTGVVSTRIGARPFNLKEQQRILRVGACLTCHPANRRNVKLIYSNFPAALKRVSALCVLPEEE